MAVCMVAHEYKKKRLKYYKLAVVKLQINQIATPNVTGSHRQR